MSSSIATLFCVCFIVALFCATRDRQSQVSSAVWVPIAWLAICASRTVSQWIGGIGGIQTSDAYVEGNPVDSAIFAALLLIGIGILWPRKQRVKEFLRANWMLVVFFLFCLLSVSWSDFPAVAFKRWIKAAGDVVMILIVLTDVNPTAALKRYLARVGFILVPVSILLIRYYPNLGRVYSQWTGALENCGVATQKNGLGYVCLMFGLTSLWCALDYFTNEGRRPSMLMAHLAVLAMTIWLFNLAHSATAFACFAVGASIMVAVRAGSILRRRLVVHMLVAAVLGIVLYGVILNPAAGLTEAVGRNATLTGRTEIWDNVLSIPNNTVIGAGYESFWLGARLQKIRRVFPTINQAHNGYLEIYLDLGWVGLALLASVILTGYRGISRTLAEDVRLGSIKLAFFVVALIYNLTEHAFRELHPVWILFLLAVIILPGATVHLESASEAA